MGSEMCIRDRGERALELSKKNDSLVRGARLLLFSICLHQNFFRAVRRPVLHLRSLGVRAVRRPGLSWRRLGVRAVRRPGLSWRRLCVRAVWRSTVSWWSLTSSTLLFFFGIGPTCSSSFSLLSLVFGLFSSLLAVSSKLPLRRAHHIFSARRAQNLKAGLLAGCAHAERPVE